MNAQAFTAGLKKFLPRRPRELLVLLAIVSAILGVTLDLRWLLESWLFLVLAREIHILYFQKRDGPMLVLFTLMTFTFIVSLAVGLILQLIIAMRVPTNPFEWLLITVAWTVLLTTLGVFAVVVFSIESPKQFNAIVQGLLRRTK